MPAATRGRPRVPGGGGSHWYEGAESHAQTVTRQRAEFEALEPRQRAAKLEDVRRALESTTRPDSPLAQLAREVYGVER